MSNKRLNRYAAIPEIRDDLQSIATAVRALKQTVDVLSRQSGNENDWAATVADLTTTVNAATQNAINNTDWGQLLNDPTIDSIFDRAAAKADKLAQDVRDEARIALAKLQTALENFKNGYADDNAIIKASISQLEASVSDTDAKITSEQLVRATETQALAGRIDTVSAQTRGNVAAVTTNITTLTNANSALASRVDTVTTASTSAKTYIQSTAPVSLATNAYWVDINGTTPVVKQWNGSTFTTLSATIAAVAPTSYSTGTLWFDTGTSLLKRWSGSAWVNTGAFVQAKTPSTIAIGDYWLDTATANTLKRWNGTAWVAVDKNDNVFGILLSTIISESLSRTDSDKTQSVKSDNLISIAPDGNSATINNTQLTTATRTQALSDDLTALEVQTTGGSAGGFYRLLASSSPGDGALAEFQVQVRAAESGTNSTFSTAGMRIQALSGGTSRVKFNTDQFIVANSTNTFTPFSITSGQLAINALTAASNVSGLGAFATLSKIPEASSATYIDAAAIKTALIADGAIVRAKILDGEITRAKIADLAVDNAKIASGAITNAKIGNLEVDSAKIANLTVANEKITAAAVSRTVYAETTTGSLTNAGYLTLYTVDARANLTTRQDTNGVKSRVFISTYTNGYQLSSDSMVQWAKVQIWSEANGVSTLIEEVYLPNDIYVYSVSSGGGDAGGTTTYQYIGGSPSYNLQVGIDNPPVPSFPILVRFQIYGGITSTAYFTRLPKINFMAFELSK